MARPLQSIKVYGVQDRRSSAGPLPWITRWSIDGRQRSKSFRTRAEAERLRGELLQCVHRGDRFDPATGEPESWQQPLGDLTVLEWSRRWLAEQWPEWQPRTRASAVEALVRFVVVTLRRPEASPGKLRGYLAETLVPESGDAQVTDREAWLARNSTCMGELDRTTATRLHRALGLRLDGGLLAPTTATRHRSNVHACIRAAVDAGALESDPWPPPRRTRSRRKATRPRRKVDLRALPDPETMARAIEAIGSHQPGSHTYRVMTAVAYYAGLRPSEVVMLRVSSLDLPSTGWGHIDVTEADVSFDEPGEPKTGPRKVPVPPVLVRTLQAWLEEHTLAAPDALLFRTRNGTRPSASNWGRAWHRALRSIDHPPLRVYDCRHAAATTWLRAGVPLGETAHRLGHSVETLVSTYVGSLDGDEALGNARIEAALEGVG